MGFRLLKDHCNYAVNSYFQRKGQAQHSCDFSGTTAVSPNPPPNVASTCSFPSSSTGANTGTTPNGTTTTGSTITGSTTRIPTTVFGGAGTTLGLKGTTSINDPSSVVGLFTNNLFCTFVATITLWILGSSWL
ncbi:PLASMODESMATA CALLOSE-BINDING PROTEIN 3-like [Hibiscus syriacus]|uniref:PLASMODESMATA CALLOSE-BINDING PROTEIN 3-like n=1 Tax=Hibiscus syriacus TaxID=106335 RepID=UPI001923319B|nr:PLASMODESMATA CALLOSE-BINDING PROTEIN 3-like [Hibiscus syriacus]